MVGVVSGRSYMLEMGKNYQEEETVVSKGE